MRDISDWFISSSFSGRSMVERMEDDAVPFTSCVVGTAFDHQISIDPWWVSLVGSCIVAVRQLEIVDIRWWVDPKDGLLSLLLVVVVSSCRISVRMIDRSLEERCVTG